MSETPARPAEIQAEIPAWILTLCARAMFELSEVSRRALLGRDPDRRDPDCADDGTWEGLLPNHQMVWTAQAGAILRDGLSAAQLAEKESKHGWGPIGLGLIREDWEQLVAACHGAYDCLRDLHDAAAKSGLHRRGRHVLALQESERFREGNEGLDLAPVHRFARMWSTAVGASGYESKPWVDLEAELATADTVEAQVALFRRAAELKAEQTDREGFAILLHDRAFADDREGRNAYAVEGEYRRALALSPCAHPVWWGDLIAFLLANGRYADAVDVWDSLADEDGSRRNIAEAWEWEPPDEALVRFFERVYGAAVDAPAALREVEIMRLTAGDLAEGYDTPEMEELKSYARARRDGHAFDLTRLSFRLDPIRYARRKVQP